jgi:hypothetical protein
MTLQGCCQKWRRRVADRKPSVMPMAVVAATTITFPADVPQGIAAV